MKIWNAAWLGVGGALGLVIIAIAIATTVVPQVGKFFEIPSEFAKRIADGVQSWGQNKISICMQADRLEVKPIAEFAFSKIRVRSIVDYKTTAYGSTKHIIAHQAFDIRWGWSFGDDVTIRMTPENGTMHVLATKPRILSITHVGDSPVFLLREDGIINKLTPEDAIALQKQLEDAARNSPDLQDGIDVSKVSFENTFRALFKSQGLGVAFEYK